MKKTNVSGVLFSDNLVTVVQEMTALKSKLQEGGKVRERARERE